MLCPLAAAILCLATVLHGEEPNPTLRIRVKVVNGYLAVDSIVSEPKEALSHFRDAKAARQTLLDDLSRALTAMGRVYCAAATVSPCPAKLPAWATKSQPWADFRAEFSRNQAARRADLKPLDSILAGDFFLSNLRVIDDETGLLWDLDQENNSDWEKGETEFLVLPPVGSWKFDAFADGSSDSFVTRENGDQGSSVATDEELLAIIRSWQGRVWQASVIKSQIEQLYDSRRVVRAVGKDVLFTLKVDRARETPRVITIHEGARLAEVTAPNRFPQSSSIALHQTLPDRDYRSLKGKTSISYPSGNRPILTYDRLAVNSAPWGLAFGLPQFVEPIPGGQRELKSMAFDCIEPRSSGPPKPKPQFSVGGGFVWRPEQGFHLKIRGRERGLMRNSGGLSAEAGSTNAGPLGKLEWTSDYVLFGKFQRRLQLNANGNTDVQTKRLIRGRLLDERRWTAQAGFNLEWFHDRGGGDLSTNVQARRLSVTLTAQDNSTSHINLAVLDIATSYRWGDRHLLWGRDFTVDLRVSAGPGVFHMPRYTTAVAAVRFVQRMPHRLEYHSSAQYGQATRDTPVIELLSMGSDETIRGFRADDALARRLIAWQNEIWTPLPLPAAKPFRPRGKVAGYIHDNVLFAIFGDIGGAWQTASGVPGPRRGAGAGIRWRIQRLISLKLDYGFGFGPGPTRGRFYIGADIGTR